MYYLICTYMGLGSHSGERERKRMARTLLFEVGRSLFKSDVYIQYSLLFLQQIFHLCIKWIAE